MLLNFDKNHAVLIDLINGGLVSFMWIIDYYSRFFLESFENS